VPEREPFNAPVIVDAQGKPARQAIDTKCPDCRSARRRLSGGFGSPHDICADCGHDFFGECTADE
jgi:uncharacterized protein (DUF983 family)